MDYQQFAQFKPLADDPSAQPSFLVSMADFLLDPMNWTTLSENGIEPEDAISTAYEYLFRVANSDPGDDGVHRGRAGRAIADLYYKPMYHIVNLEEAGNWYQWAAKESRHDSSENVLYCLRQAARCSLYRGEIEQARNYCDAMTKYDENEDGWVDFCEFGFQHDHAESATRLLNHLLEEENLEAMFLCARMFVPDAVGEDVDSEVKDLFLGCMERLKDAWENDHPKKYDYISVYARYLYTQNPDEFFKGPYYKALVKGARDVLNAWANYFAGLVMYNEAAACREAGDTEAANNAAVLADNCMHYAADEGCRPAMRYFTLSMEAEDDEQSKAIAQEYADISKIFDVDSYFGG